MALPSYKHNDLQSILSDRDQYAFKTKKALSALAFSEVMMV